MAYDIILKSPQEFTPSASNELFYQFWKTDPEGPLYVQHFIGSPAPDPILINFQIENHFITEPAGKYTAFYVNARIIAWTGQYPNLHLSGEVADGEPGVLLTENNLQQNTTLSFQSLGLLSPGTVNGLIEFYVNGVRADSGLTEKFISRRRIYVELKTLEQTGLITNKQDLYFSHIKEAAPLPGRQLQIITAANFEIRLSKYYEITGGNVVYVGEIFGDKVKYTGSGNQTVTVSLKQEFDFYTESVFTSYMEIENLDIPQGEFLVLPWYINMTAYLMDAHGFVTDPQALEFFSIKGVEGGDPQALSVFASQAFNVSFPFWLQVSPTAGDNFAVFSVKPISANNLVAGDYNGVITLTSADAVLEVPVLLKVVESIDQGFSKSEINFAGNNNQVSSLYSDDLNERAALDLEITAYDYKGFGVVTSHPFKVAFFQSKTEIHIGEIVARRFKKINSLGDIGYRQYNLETEDPQLFQIFNYYKPAAVDISLEIESRKTGSVSKEKNFNDVQFVNGRRPKQYQANYGILNYDTVPVRVTRKSQLLFNFIRRFQDHEIKIYRNNVLYKTVTHSPGGNSLFGMAIYFKDFKPGDVIDVRMGGDFVQQYVVFPDQDYSNHIVFMNEYNLLEAYEFTGALNFNSDYENTSSKTYKQLVEYLENLETTKDQMLVINSGWILKSNQVIMDAIIRAKRVWFVNGGKEISLTPVSKKMVNEDSQQELYEYNLEFKINRENDLEVYTS